MKDELDDIPPVFLLYVSLAIVVVVAVVAIVAAKVL
jgi:hypothetical protein